MKRASYRHAVSWIAVNDAPGDELDELELAGFISVLLVADVFAVEAERVAGDVLRVRRRIRRKDAVRLEEERGRVAYRQRTYPLACRAAESEAFRRGWHKAAAADGPPAWTFRNG